MTKEEVRTIALSKLDLGEDDVLWDVGAGSGSVGLQAALCSPVEAVCAIEVKHDALRLIKENREHLKADKLKIFAGRAPDCFEQIFDRPTKVFIGGSGGQLDRILAAVFEKASVQIVVMTAITLKTLEEARRFFNERDDLFVSIAQIQISRFDRLGSMGMAESENPIFLLCAERQVISGDA